MRKIYSLISLFVFVVMVTIVNAQAPQAFAFQSTITDSVGNPFSNQNITVQFAIHSGSSNGTIVYSEQHNSVMTSASGYFSVNVGSGTPITGTFSNIDWSTSSYWLELLVDTTGGSSVLSMGASQLLSVPYALHSADVVPSVYYRGTVVAGYSNPGTPIVMLFDDAINRGLAYNPVTGIYTVTVDGIYEVIASNGGLITYVVCNLLLNGVPIANHYANLVLELSIGDTIYMECDDYSSGSILQIKEIK